MIFTQDMTSIQDMTCIQDMTRIESTREATRGQRSGAWRRQRGFSFIEILIVMGIIGVLIGGVLVAIGIWNRKGPEFATNNTLTKASSMIDTWKTTFDMYPPSDVTRIGDVTNNGSNAVLVENTHNGPIEAIYQALYWPGFRPDPGWTDEELSNTDKDKLGKAVNKHDTTALMEIRDAWGNPLVYFHRDDYARAFDSGVIYLNYEGLDVEAQPYKRENGTFYNPSSYQIWSMGEDGEPNTDDDILPWK